MKFAARSLLLGLLVSIYFAASASAQYMKITTDNPTDNTRMRPSGTTILTITLDTDHDKNASLQTCNSHTAANGCGSATDGLALDMFSYTLALKATGGTVVWGTFTPSDAAYTDAAPVIFNETEIEINKTRPSGTVSAAGLNSIGTLPVTPLTGSPSIGLQIGPGALNPFGFGTGFGTDCDGFFFPNTYVVGDPADPCGNVNGIAGDWFDWDGALPWNGNSPPTIAAPPTATGVEGTAITPITATATDPDAGNTLTMTQTGMPGSLAFSSSPGPSPNTATVSGTPGFASAGIYNINWLVNDGFGLSSYTSTQLTIANTDRAPTLTQPANMTVNEGSTADQTLMGFDPDGDPLTFQIVAGPPYMFVVANTAKTGTIRLAPNFSSAGTSGATVRASDGTLYDDKSFLITVYNTNRAPTLNPPASMTVTEGTTADQTVAGSDPDGDALTFTKSAGPTFMTVTTSTATLGNVHLTPVAGDAGASPYSVQVTATDTGALSDTKTFQVTVIAGVGLPVLAQPANMTVNEGATADQTLNATDPDGNALTFSLASGPTYASVTTTTPGTGTATGNLHLAPGFSDAGTASASVQVSDGSLMDSKSFTITVNNVNRAPTLNAIADMTVNEGATADQVITGSDPDGDALTFTKTAGPAFLTVTTTNPTTGNVHLAPGFSDAGVYGATATASDGSLTSSRSFNVTVNNVDRAPVLAAIANQTVAEGATADVAVSATDADGDVITLSATLPSFATLTSVPAAGTVNGSIHIAPNFGDAAGSPYSATVTASSGSPSLTSTRNFTITVTGTNRPPVLVQPANMTVDEGTTADQTLTASDPDGNPLTFTKVSGPLFLTVTSTTGTTGNAHLAPGFSDGNGNPSTYAATVTASDGSLADSKSLTISVNNTNRPPIVSAPLSVSTFEGSAVFFSVSATDPDGDMVRLTVLNLPVGATFIDNGGGSGAFSWTPGFNQAGTYSVGFIGRDNQGAISTPGTVAIVVNDLNRAPVSSAGGPYSGVVNVPITFNGSGSSDPDGSPLTYLWDFGDAMTGVGVTPQHAYTAGGAFTVMLTVSDGLLTGSASSTATIQDTFSARAFTTNGYGTIRLGSGKASWCVQIEPVGGSYLITAVLGPTITMKYGTGQILAIPGKADIGADKDGNGIQELTACFSKADLRTLFSGLHKGTTTVSVTLEGDLSTGGKFRTTLTIDVVGTGGGVAATVSPNPLNPEAILSFTVSRPGQVRVSIYGLDGRLVRTLLEGTFLDVGRHDLRIDGQSNAGTRLASGIYFYRIEAPEGAVTGQFAVMK